MEAKIAQANKVLESNVLRMVPKKILQGCKAIAILNTQEFALGISGGGGDGILIKHNDDGSWGPPAAISIGFAGIGFNIGETDKQILMVPMTDEALKRLTEDSKFTVGVELGLAIGPGREAELALTGLSPIYSYVFESGLIVKGGLSGSTIFHDKIANEKFYGANKTPTEIIMEPGAVTPPAGNAALESLYKNLAVE